MANCLFSWQQDNKHIKRVFMLFVTALSYQQWDLCSSTSVSHSSPFLWVSYVCSQAWRGQRCRNLTNFQIRLSPCLLNRGRKRTLSQNKRWGADPFPCAVKQSLHSELSKWHLIWFCCWSLDTLSASKTSTLAVVPHWPAMKEEKSDEPSRRTMHTSEGTHTYTRTHFQMAENILK